MSCCNPFLNIFAFSDPEDPEKVHNYLVYILSKISSLVNDFSLIDRLVETQSVGKAAESKTRQESPEPKNGGEYLIHEEDLQEQIRLGTEATELLEMLDDKRQSLDQFKSLWTEVMKELGKSLEEKVSSQEEPLPSGEEEAASSGQELPQSNVFTSKNKNVGMTLPIQHFDMMYNILKRVASVSYHDIPEEAHKNEAYFYFGRLYENIGHELEAQDKGYGATASGLASKYYASFFYKFFMEKDSNDPYFNPYFKDFFDSVIQHILVNSRERKKNELRPNYD